MLTLGRGEDPCPKILHPFVSCARPSVAPFCPRRTVAVVPIDTALHRQTAHNWRYKRIARWVATALFLPPWLPFRPEMTPALLPKVNLDRFADFVYAGSAGGCLAEPSSLADVMLQAVQLNSAALGAGIAGPT